MTAYAFSHQIERETNDGACYVLFVGGTVFHYPEEPGTHFSPFIAASLEVDARVARVDRIGVDGHVEVNYYQGFIGPPEPVCPVVPGITHVDELPEKEREKLIESAWDLIAWHHGC